MIHREGNQETQHNDQHDESEREDKQVEPCHPHEREEMTRKKEGRKESTLLIHICWNVDSDARIDPPIQVAYLRSGGAIMRTCNDEATL